MIGPQLNTVQSLHYFLNPQEQLLPSRSLADYTICSVIYLECLFSVPWYSSFFSNLHWYQYSTLPTATFTWIVSWKPQMETRQEGPRNLLQGVEREWAVQLKDDCCASWFVRSKRKWVWSSAPLLLSHILQLHLQFQLTLAGGKRTYFDHSHTYASDMDRDIITGFERALICSMLDDSHQHLLGCWPVKTFMGVEPSTVQTLPGAAAATATNSWRKIIPGAYRPHPTQAVLSPLYPLTLTASVPVLFAWHNKFSQTWAQLHLCWISQSTLHNVWGGKHHVTWFPTLQCVWASAHLLFESIG